MGCAYNNMNIDAMRTTHAETPQQSICLVLSVNLKVPIKYLKCERAPGLAGKREQIG